MNIDPQIFNLFHKDNPNYRLLFSTIFGSHMWGMDTAASDKDIAIIYAVPSRIILEGRPYSKTLPQKKITSVEDPKKSLYELTYWEIGHLIQYLLKGNQNAIWMTCSNISPVTCGMHLWLQNIIKHNLCKETYHSCKGMAESQISDAYKRNLGMKGLRSAWRTTNFGINLLTKGEVIFDAAPDFVTEEMCRLKLEELNYAFEISVLPDRPNPENFYNWLYAMRRTL